jgi:hypothetical protein
LQTDIIAFPLGIESIIISPLNKHSLLKTCTLLLKLTLNGLRVIIQEILSDISIIISNFETLFNLSEGLTTTLSKFRELINIKYFTNK